MQLTFRSLWLAALVLGATASFSAADVQNGGFEDGTNTDWLGCPLGACPPTTSTYVVIQGGSDSYLQIRAAPNGDVVALQDGIFVEACVRNAGYATLQFDARYGSDCGAAIVRLDVGSSAEKEIPYTSGWTTYKLSVALDCPTDAAEIVFALCPDADVASPGTALDVDDVTLCWTSDDQSTGLDDLDGCEDCENICQPTTSNPILTCGTPSGTQPDDCPLCCPWDLDDDGEVGPGDLAILLGAWGSNPGSPADFTCDDTVDAADLAELYGNWGRCPS